MDAAINSSQQSFTTATPNASQSSVFSLAIPSSSFPASTASSTSTLTDPNSPELFKHNIQIAMEQVARVNALARSALNGIQNAYQAGVHPAQTQADLTALDQAMHVLADMLRQSGVGAYPLPAPDARNASAQTEQELIADTTRGVQQLYDEFKRMQESSAVVVNLLAAPEGLGRPKA
ncbi:hypothetical protein HD554DRAFT_2023708 [Boletus coccyginus]|nr:hypothetical protein HD554DRAFT_2023708 [Boletus coccyginus]